jgi:hypothetical protein
MRKALQYTNKEKLDKDCLNSDFASHKFQKFHTTSPNSLFSGLRRSMHDGGRARLGRAFRALSQGCVSPYQRQHARARSTEPREQGCKVTLILQLHIMPGRAAEDATTLQKHCNRHIAHEHEASEFLICHSHDTTSRRERGSASQRFLQLPPLLKPGRRRQQPRCPNQPIPRSH